MKIKVLVFFLFIVFAVTGVAFAMPKMEVVPSLSEPVIMFLFGLLLTGVSVYGRKAYAEQRVNRHR